MKAGACIVAGCVFLLFAFFGQASLHWVLLFFIAGLGAALVLIGANAALGATWATSAFYVELKKFLKSPLFYLLFGCVFLVAAHFLQYAVQSAFLFLIAVLGVALVLFGTGTQAVASSDSNWVKGSVAGGAGALALILGYGIVEKRTEIRDVFHSAENVGIVEVVNEDVRALDFEKDYDAVARLSSGRRLHLWRDQKIIEILVPYSPLQKSLLVILELKPKGPPAQDRDDRDSKPIPVAWEKGQQEGSENAKSYRFRHKLNLVRVESVTREAAGSVRLSLE